MKRLKTYKLNITSRTLIERTCLSTRQGRNESVLIKRLSFLLFTFVFSFNIVLGQTFSVEVNKDSITVGDPLTLILKLQSSKNKRYIWPTFFKGDSLPDAFEVLEVFEKQKSNNNKGLTTQQLTITSFEPGNHTLDPFVIQDTAGVLTSNPINIHVSLFAVDTTQPIRDIKPIKEASLTFKDKWYQFLNWLKSNWYWVLAIIVGLVILFWLLFKKRKTHQEPTKDKVTVKEKKTVPAHIQALKKLHAIKDEKPWENGDFKTYSTRLTDVMRIYIQGRYQISTKEKTSSQILNELENKTIPDTLKGKLRSLLTLSDLVKFAKQEPTNEESENILNDAMDFVNQTTPKQE